MTHPVPAYVYVLQGALTVQFMDGTAALVTDTPVADVKPAPAQIIRIMNLADPLHPTVAQEFKGVTATSRDAQPGLILLANADGIWILQQHFALDPAVEKSYAYFVTHQ